MAQIQSIKRRIKSVTSTRQITKAMELVAAVKMRKAQSTALKARPYAHMARGILAQLYRLAGPDAHPLLRHRPIRNRLVIVMTSDRGLAGAYNSNIFRILLESLQAEKENVGVKLIVIGQKGAQFAAKLANIELLGVYTNWPTEPQFADIQPIASTAMKNFIDGSVDSVQLLFTEFTSPIKQTAMLHDLLPITTDTIFAAGETPHLPEDTKFEPSAGEVLNAILPRLVEVQIYQANREAIASEHSMRMIAMKNASDNAGTLIDDLTLTYNSARQAAITQELAEITSGAEIIS